jgi:hypothetical protein
LSNLIPHLLPEWRWVLLRAWSSRLMIASGVLSAGAAAVSMIDGQAIGHPALVPILCFVLNMGALGARVMQQKSLGGPNGNEPT